MAKEKKKKDAVAKRGTSVALTREGLIGSVNRRIEALTKGQELMVPKHYAVGNAMSAWWLRIQKPIDKGKNAGKTPMELSTDESVISATLDMVVLGLDPAKEQCYPIVYGKTLVCQPSYLGRIKTLKDVYPKARLFAQVVYEDDKFERHFDKGRLVIDEHTPGDNANVNGKESGAYVFIDLGEEHEPHVEYMTIAQIRKAWGQGGSKGDSPAHNNFPGEMCKKTVDGRGSKVLVKSSNHSYLVAAVERQEALTVEAEMDAEVAEKANADVIDFIDGPDGELIQVAPQKDDGEAPATEGQQDADQPDGEAQGSPSSPAARFQDLINGNELNPTDARKLVAKAMKRDDARKITNDDYAQVLADPEAFLDWYKAEYGEKKTEPPVQQDEPPEALPGF